MVILVKTPDRVIHLDAKGNAVRNLGPGKPCD